jgi:hypothetical protein
MPEQSLNIRTAVLRAGAHNYILISLVSFGGTVMITRLFLAMTGYPKIGSGELHIAHVLWGGLILFLAALLPLIYANKWILSTSAFLSGVGVGLFIDEVGKFITMRNDYFFPPAAPIIYALFLLTVLVYLRARRQLPWNARTELYHILDGFSEVLDRDLEPSEKADLLKRLDQIVKKTDEEDLANLAQSLMDFLQHGKLEAIPDRLSFAEKSLATVQSLEKRTLNRGRMRLVLIIAMSVVGILAITDVFGSILSDGRLMTLDAIITTNMRLGAVRSQTGASWFFVHLTLQYIVGILALISAGLIAAGKEKKGLELGVACMVISLTMVNLLAFFVAQFSAALTALLQLAVLLVLVYYRRRYMLPTRSN